MSHSRGYFAEPNAVRARNVCRRMSAINYKYELRRGEEIVATGHLSCEQPLAVGERLTIGTREGIVRTVDGEEGVDGSSPSEGSAKAPHVGAFSFRSTCS